MFGDLPTAKLASEPANSCCDAEILAVSGALSNHRVDSNDHHDFAEKASRVETISSRFAVRNWLNAINFRYA